jgi:hypothetical protein
VEEANRDMRRVREGKGSTIVAPIRMEGGVAGLKNSIMTVTGVMGNRVICPQAWEIMM